MEGFKNAFEESMFVGLHGVGGGKCGNLCEKSIGSSIRELCSSLIDCLTLDNMPSTSEP